MSFQVAHTRKPLGDPGLEIEATVVLRAFDLVAHHKAVTETDIFVGAKPVGRKDITVVVAEDGVAGGPANLLETANTLGLPLYARQMIDAKGRWIDLMTEASILPVNKRPRLAIRIFSSN